MRAPWSINLSVQIDIVSPYSGIALPIAGDDADGKQLVFDLIDALGFDPVDGGTLAESWRQQPGTPVYGTDLDAEGATRALAEASPERPEGFRAER